MTRDAYFCDKRAVAQMVVCKHAHLQAAQVGMKSSFRFV